MCDMRVLHGVDCKEQDITAMKDTLLEHSSKLLGTIKEAGASNACLLNASCQISYLPSPHPLKTCRDPV